MDPQLYNGMNLSKEEMLERIQAVCIATQDGFEYVQDFSDDEIQEKTERYMTLSKEKYLLDEELKSISEPLKDEIKVREKEMKPLIKSINAGGEKVKETIFLIPDYESRTMGMYNSEGRLVGTRRMNVNENQLNINSKISGNG